MARSAKPRKILLELLHERPAGEGGTRSCHASCRNRGDEARGARRREAHGSQGNRTEAARRCGARADPVPGAHVQPAGLAQRQPGVGTRLGGRDQRHCLGVPYVWGAPFRDGLRLLGSDEVRLAAWRPAAALQRRSCVFPKLDPAGSLRATSCSSSRASTGRGTWLRRGDGIIRPTPALVRYSVSHAAAALGFSLPCARPRPQPAAPASRWWFKSRCSLTRMAQ